MLPPRLHVPAKDLTTGTTSRFRVHRLRTAQIMSQHEAGYNDVQAMRSSCDRCRSQKLKCTTPSGNDGPGSCDRCARAKVSCVFSRRRRASRAVRAKRRVDTSLQTLTPPGPATPTSFDSPELQATRELLTQSWSRHNAHNLFYSEFGSFDFHHQDGLDDLMLFEMDKLDATQWPDMDAAALPLESGDECTDHGALDIAATDNAALDVVRQDDCNTMMQQLLALMSDLQQRQKALEEGPWQHNSNRGLDDYPLGTVLHLSERFSTIVHPFLASKGQAGSEIPRSSGRAGAGQISAVSTPTALLILSGYVSLRRIYSIVLGHFQDHLSQLPTSTMATDEIRSLVSRPTSLSLQLGELPYAGPNMGLGRTHTAVCMLLDTLQSVEELIMGASGHGLHAPASPPPSMDGSTSGQTERGGVAWQDLFIAVRRQEAMGTASGLEDCFTDLNKKANAVKELLRQRMGL